MREIINFSTQRIPCASSYVIVLLIACVCVCVWVGYGVFECGIVCVWECFSNGMNCQQFNYTYITHWATEKRVPHLPHFMCAKAILCVVCCASLPNSLVPSTNIYMYKRNKLISFISPYFDHALWYIADDGAGEKEQLAMHTTHVVKRRRKHKALSDFV